MEKGVIQNLRYKLQKRTRKLNAVQNDFFNIGLLQYWKFLNSNSVFQGILIDLEQRSKNSETDANKIVNENQSVFGEDEEESVYLAFRVLKKTIESENNSLIRNIAYSYIRSMDMSQVVEFWKDLFIEPLYEYIDEQLDDQKATLVMLNRYKAKCEWFNREKLYTTWADNTQKGEKLLSLNLYEFLFDQGIEFYIEPTSISGEADLVSAQSGKEPLIADVKIFNPEKSKGKKYIAEGFNQIYQYTLDFNEPFGYLIIFKTCENDLRFALSEKEQSIPFVIHNNKTIFLIVIDIYPHEKSASKRGTLKAIQITENDLIELVGS